MDMIHPIICLGYGFSNLVQGSVTIGAAHICVEAELSVSTAAVGENIMLIGSFSVAGDPYPESWRSATFQVSELSCTLPAGSTLDFIDAWEFRLISLQGSGIEPTFAVVANELAVNVPVTLRAVVSVTLGLS